MGRDDNREPQRAASWTLEDGEALHAAHPRTFFTPPLEHRTDVRVGESCGLSIAFSPRQVEGATRSSEALWVSVVEVLADGRYRGRVDEAPTLVDDLRLDDVIDFQPRHIVAIAYSPDELGYDPGDWAIIDARIMAEDEPPLALTFAEPNGFDERHWFGALDQQPPQESQWVQLGELTDRWPELVKVFTSDSGMWRRAKSKGTYEPV